MLLTRERKNHLELWKEQVSSNKCGLSHHWEEGGSVWIKMDEQRCVHQTVPRAMLLQKSGPGRMWCILRKAFGKMRLDHIPAVVNNVRERGCVTVQQFLCFAEGEFWTPRVVRIVDHQWTTCSGIGDRGWENSRCLCPCVKAWPSWLWEGGGSALGYGFCEVTCEFIILSESAVLWASLVVQPNSLLQKPLLLQ